MIETVIARRYLRQRQERCHNEGLIGIILDVGSEQMPYKRMRTIFLVRGDNFRTNDRYFQR